MDYGKRLKGFPLAANGLRWGQGSKVLYWNSVQICTRLLFKEDTEQLFPKSDRDKRINLLSQFTQTSFREAFKQQF